MTTPYISVTDTSTFITSEPTLRYDNGHPNSPWRRIAIIPIWVLELGLLAVNAVVAGMLIGITKSGSGPGKNEVQPYAHPHSVSVFYAPRTDKVQMDSPEHPLCVNRPGYDLRRSHDVRLPRTGPEILRHFHCH